jgi:hypothetical protein
MRRFPEPALVRVRSEAAMAVFTLFLAEGANPKIVLQISGNIPEPYRVYIGAQGCRCRIVRPMNTF